MTSINLSEYFPQPSPPFVMTTYFDKLSKYIMTDITREYLTPRDRFFLSLAFMPEKKEVSIIELDRAEIETKETLEEEKYWNNYDYRDEIDIEYGEQDFSLEQDKYKDCMNEIEIEYDY